MTPILSAPLDRASGLRSSPRHASDRRANEGSLVLVGVNHTTAPIEVRERLAIPASRLADATRTLAQQPGIREALILSTCNRVEFITIQDRASDSNPPDLLRFLHEYFAVPAATARAAPLRVPRARGRPPSLPRCQLAGLHGRRRAADPRPGQGVLRHRAPGRAVSTALEPLLQRAFSVAKRVRTETQIGSSSVSIASVAVDLARKIFGSLRGKTVLHRRRGQDVRPGRASPHPAGRNLHPRRQPHPGARRATRRPDRRPDLHAARRRAHCHPRLGLACTTEVIPFDQLTPRPPAPTSSSPPPAPSSHLPPRPRPELHASAAATAPCSSSTSPSPATSTPR